MDGFGVHTFRFVTADGSSKFVKWHWKTKQGKASLVWEEAQVLAGKNADFHRQDLWNAIASGNGPEWVSGQSIPPVHNPTTADITTLHYMTFETRFVS